MKKLLLLSALLLNICYAQQIPSLTSGEIPSLSTYDLQLVNRIKLAKDYFMNSSDPAAGRTFEERTKKLSNYIKGQFADFTQLRTKEYSSLNFEFKGSDWATNKQTPKTETIPSGQYTFFKIERTRTGDWKDGPVINNIDRRLWESGEIPGGNVWWVTGGQGKSSTYWKIAAKYSTSHIDYLVANELKTVKNRLTTLNIPSEI